MEKWGVKLDVCTQPPIPPGRRGRSNSRATGLVCVSCSHAEIDDRKTKLVQRDETAERCLDTPQDRSQRPMRTTCDELPSECQMACTMPALRFRVRFDIDDRSQRSSNS